MEVHYESLRSIKKEIIITRMLLLLLCLGEAKHKTCIKRSNGKLQALSITEKPKNPQNLVIKQMMITYRTGYGYDLRFALTCDNKMV